MASNQDRRVTNDEHASSGDDESEQAFFRNKTYVGWACVDFCSDGWP